MWVGSNVDCIFSSCWSYWAFFLELFFCLIWWLFRITLRFKTFLRMVFFSSSSSLFAASCLHLMHVNKCKHQMSVRFKTKEIITNVLFCLLTSLQTAFHLKSPIVFSYVLNALNGKWIWMKKTRAENKTKRKRFLALLNIMSYMGISLYNGH